MSGKRRVTTSVDADLVEAGRAVVADGGAESFSAWVNGALRRQVEHDRRLRALGDFLAAFEAEHGAITDEETHAAARRARARAVVVRGTVVRGDRDDTPPPAPDGRDAT